MNRQEITGWQRKKGGDGKRAGGKRERKLKETEMKKEARIALTNPLNKMK